jgi:hypothetical protein
LGSDEEAAKQEGSVVVHANSSRFKAVELWAEKYPISSWKAMTSAVTMCYQDPLSSNRHGSRDVWFSSGGAELSAMSSP